MHKRCSRLATIGELGRYPLLVSALKHSLKYEWQIRNQDQESIVNMAYREMAEMPQLDTWYTRVQSIKTLLGVTPLYGTEYSVNMSLGRKLKSNFDRFWLDQINELKIGNDGLDHNKLRFYKTLKGSFSQEPYITNILNRSQRTWLTRYRVSAVANLRIESGRYTRPVTPITQRVCKYCDSGSVDNERHAILECDTFRLKRNCFNGKISSLNPNFLNLSREQKLITLLCPSNQQIALCVSKYLGIITETRSKIDKGLSFVNLMTYCKI